MRIYCRPKFIDRADFFSCGRSKRRIIISDPEQIHHLAHVLRLGRGDKVSVFDGSAFEYDCLIESTVKDAVVLTVMKTRKAAVKNNIRITLACAVPKKAKMDHIVEKVTELGVFSIIPMETERTIVRLHSDKAHERLVRWQRISREASKQCGRQQLPIIEPIEKFEKVISSLNNYSLALISHLGPDTRGIYGAVFGVSAKTIIIFIGPEGDFSPAEIRLAKDSGCRSVSLGSLILKVDTAAIAAVAFLQLVNSGVK